MCSGEEISSAHLTKIEALTEVWRDLLYDISWYMKCLNDHIYPSLFVQGTQKGKYTQTT